LEDDGQLSAPFASSVAGYPDDKPPGDVRKEVNLVACMHHASPSGKEQHNLDCRILGATGKRSKGDQSPVTLDFEQCKSSQVAA